MIRNLMALPCLLALVLACGQGRSDGQDAGAAAGSGSETGALPADTGYAGSGIDDTTAAPSIDADTAAPAGDTTTGNTDSTNQDVTKTSPDGGEPVTSKGDTVGTSGVGATRDTAY